jgi:hypothetical protein
MLILLDIFFISCTSSNYSSESKNTWKVSEEKTLGINKLPLDLIPFGPEPLKFPPNIFDWQPPDTSIVVHTALESHYQYEDKSEIFTEFNNKSGLVLHFWVPGDHKFLNNLSSKMIWIAFDIEEMRFNGDLHFFEVRPDKSDKIVQNDSNIVWQPSPGVGIRTVLTANDIMIYVESTDVNIYSDDSMPTPHVKEQWANLAKKCIRPCYSKVFVWQPQLNTFEVIEVQLLYKGISPPSDYLPKITIRERI